MVYFDIVLFLMMGFGVLWGFQTLYLLYRYFISIVDKAEIRIANWMYRAFYQFGLTYTGGKIHWDSVASFHIFGGIMFCILLVIWPVVSVVALFYGSAYGLRWYKESEKKDG